MPRRKQADNLLSAEWLNGVILKVLDDIDDIVDKILFEGFFAPGYAPLAKPMGKEEVRRLTPEQIPQIMETLDPPQQQAFMKMVEEVYAEGSQEG